MSLAATDYPDVQARTKSDSISDEVALGDGAYLPRPASPPAASLIAFALLTPGSAAMIWITCFALIAIGRGGSLTLWASVLGTLYALWIPASLIALWAANDRGEWGEA